MPKIRYYVIFLTILGMEISWLYALLNASNKSVADRISIPLLMVILLVSFGISKTLRYLHWPKPALTSLSWLVWAIVMLLMVKIQLFPQTSFGDTAWLMAIPLAFSHIFVSFEPALLIFLSSIALWWFGRRLAYTRADFSATLTEFQFGLGILVIVFFTAYELNLDQSSSIPVAMSFFSLGLIGVSISHAEENNSWLNSWRQAHWPGMLLVSIGIILLLGLLVSAIVTPDFLKLILKGLAWIWGMIEKFIAFLASLFPQQTQEVGPLPAIPATPSAGQGGTIQFPEWLMPGMRLAWIILAAGLGLLTIWSISSQIFSWMRRRAGNSGGETESLKGAFRLDFINWLKRILSRIFGIKFGLPARNRSLNVPPETASVRQLYRQFLRWAADGGYPRQKSQTPNEFQSTLDNVLPENQGDLDIITRGYINARYGPALPTESELSQLKQKWYTLRKKDIKEPGNKKT